MMQSRVDIQITANTDLAAIEALNAQLRTTQKEIAQTSAALATLSSSDSSAFALQYAVRLRELTGEFEKLRTVQRAFFVEEAQASSASAWASAQITALREVKAEEESLLQRRLDASFMLQSIRHKEQESYAHQALTGEAAAQRMIGISPSGVSARQSAAVFNSQFEEQKHQFDVETAGFARVAAARAAATEAMLADLRKYQKAEEQADKERTLFLNRIAPQTPIRFQTNAAGELQAVSAALTRATREGVEFGRTIKTAGVEVDTFGKLAAHGFPLIDTLLRGNIRQFFASLGATFRDLNVSSIALYGSMAVLGGVMAAFGVERIVNKFGDLALKEQTAAAAAGLDVESYSRLRGVFTLLSGDAGRLDQVFGMLSEHAQQAKIDPLSKSASAFASIGVSLQQLTEGMTNPISLLETLRQRWQSMGDSMERTEVFRAILGRGFAALVPYLRMSSSELEKLNGMVEKTGDYMTGGVANGLSEAAIKSHEFSMSIQGLEQSLAVLVADSGIVDWLRNQVEKTNVAAFGWSHLGDVIRKVSAPSDVPSNIAPTEGFPRRPGDALANQARQGEWGSWGRALAGPTTGTASATVGPLVDIRAGGALTTPGGPPNGNAWLNQNAPFPTRMHPQGEGIHWQSNFPPNSVGLAGFGAESQFPGQVAPMAPVGPTGNLTGVGGAFSGAAQRAAADKYTRIDYEKETKDFDERLRKFKEQTALGEEQFNTQRKGTTDQKEQANIEVQKAAYVKQRLEGERQIRLERDAQLAKAGLTQDDPRRVAARDTSGTELTAERTKGDIAEKTKQAQIAGYRETEELIRTQIVTAKLAEQEILDSTKSTAQQKVAAVEQFKATAANAYAGLATQAATIYKTDSAEYQRIATEKVGIERETQKQIAELRRKTAQEAVKDAEMLQRTARVGVQAGETQIKIEQFQAKQSGGGGLFTGGVGVYQQEVALAKQAGAASLAAAQAAVAAQDVIIANTNSSDEQIKAAELKKKEILVQSANEQLALAEKVADSWKKLVAPVTDFFNSIGSSIESGAGGIVKALIAPQQEIIHAGLKDIKTNLQGQEIRQAIGQMLISAAQDAAKTALGAVGNAFASMLLGGVSGSGLSEKLTNTIMGWFGKSAPAAAGSATTAASATTLTASFQALNAAVLQSTAALGGHSATTATATGAQAVNTGATQVGTVATTLGTATKQADTTATVLGTAMTTSNTAAELTNTAAVTTNSAAQSASSAGSGLGIIGKAFGFIGGLFGLEQGGIIPSAAGGMITAGGAGGQLAILHPNEMVLPAHISAAVQRGANASMPRYGYGNMDNISHFGDASRTAANTNNATSNANLTYSPTINTGASRMSRSEFSDMLRSHAPDMMGMARQVVRSGWRG